MNDIVKATCEKCGLAWSVLLSPDVPESLRVEAREAVDGKLADHRCYPTEPKGRTHGSIRLDPRRPLSPRSIYA